MGTFLASLNHKQLTALTELFNGQRVFQPEVDTNTVAALFMCRLKEPLVVCNTRTLCYIFHILGEEQLITPIWQELHRHSKKHQIALTASPQGLFIQPRVSESEHMRTIRLNHPYICR